MFYTEINETGFFGMYTKQLLTFVEVNTMFYQPEVDNISRGWRPRNYHLPKFKKSLHQPQQRSKIIYDN